MKRVGLFCDISQVYKTLADVACPMLQAYRGDLYHDAMKVHEIFSGSDGFENIYILYGVRKTGTHMAIGTVLGKILENEELLKQYNKELYLFVCIPSRFNRDEKQTPVYNVYRKAL